MIGCCICLQVDFGNSVGHEIAEQKIYTPKTDDDIHLVMRVVGDFSYQFKLNNFPADYQDLDVTLEIRCDKKGLTPVPPNTSHPTPCVHEHCPLPPPPRSFCLCAFCVRSWVAAEGDYGYAR